MSITIDYSRATPALCAALVRAQRAVRSVGKDGRNQQRGYNYATSEAMIRAGREHLNEAGLALLDSFEVEPAPAPAGDIGKQHVCSRVIIPWVLVHEEGGMLSGRASMAAVASPARPNDKAEAATVTYALGFLIRGLLKIDRAEEDDLAPDQRPDAEPDRLWMAYEAKRDAVAKARNLTADQAHVAIREAANVRYRGSPTDEQVEQMMAAAERMLAPREEPVVPKDRDRVAVKGEINAPAKAPRGKAKPEAEKPEPTQSTDPVAPHRARFQAAYRGYKAACEARKLTPLGWIEMASEAIGRTWNTNAGSHGAEDYDQAADYCEKAVAKMRSEGAAA